jgi:hypothetical protein|tara:strand:+ start:308 stop:754 length:447 start_codon:yes stop_codon:yes gene_type:complete
MNLEKIQEEWAKDCVIDKIDMDKASLETPKLHSKYLDELSSKRLNYKKYEVEYNKLLKNKWLWYTDKLSKEEIDELGWSYDPFEGHKVLKADYNYYFNADKDLTELKLKLEYLQECIDVLKDILNILTWRHQSIKNAIDWLKFTNPAG